VRVEFRLFSLDWGIAINDDVVVTALVTSTKLSYVSPG